MALDGAWDRPPASVTSLPGYLIGCRQLMNDEASNSWLFRLYRVGRGIFAWTGWSPSYRLSLRLLVRIGCLYYFIVVVLGKYWLKQLCSSNLTVACVHISAAVRLELFRRKYRIHSAYCKQLLVIRIVSFMHRRNLKATAYTEFAYPSFYSVYRRPIACFRLIIGLLFHCYCYNRLMIEWGWTADYTHKI